MLNTQKIGIKRLFRGIKRWWFQQDGAPSHKDKDSVKFIRKNLTKNILPHPAQSPDLNPIELIWAKMKKEVEMQCPQTKNDLLEAITNSWKNINLRFIRKCIMGIKKKMKEIVKNEGNLQ